MVSYKAFGKSYIKIIFRAICGSIGRFAAIFAITTLGIGFLSGLLATTSDMKLTMGNYLKQLNTMDIFIKSTMGFGEGDLSAVRAIDGVKDAESGYVMDAIVQTSDLESFVTRVYSTPAGTARINQLELVDGRMPNAANECVVQNAAGDLVAPQIGTKLHIAGETLNYKNTYGNFDDLSEVFAQRDFVVTGVVRSPLHISWDREPSRIGNGRLSMVIFVPPEAYSLESPTDFYITVEGAIEAPAFTDQYRAIVDPVVHKIESLGKNLSPLRAADVLSIAKERAERRLQKGQTEFDAAKAAAMAELDAGRKKIAEGRTKLAEERLRVAAEFTKNEAALDDGEAQLTSARAQLADAKAQMDAVADRVEQARNSALANTAQARDGIAQYDAGRRSYNDGMLTVAQKEAEIKDGREQLESGKIKAQAEFEKAESDLADGEAEFAAAEAAALAKLAAAEQDLADGRDRLSLLDGTDAARWYVLDRNYNLGFVIYENNAEKIDDVARVFPIFFLLIAILVVLSTMTRMVEEDRLQIGTLKALGYQKRTIILQYLVYCALTGILGSLAGMAIGFQIFPRIIYTAFSTQGYLPPFAAAFHRNFALFSCGIVLSATVFSTINACYRCLHEKPAALLLPRIPKSGKRILLESMPFIWNRMKFSSKVTARNLIRQKKHFFMTIIGIAGCTALIVAGFGLRDSIFTIARTQFNSILKYDAQISTNDGTNTKAIKALLPEGSLTLDIWTGDATVENGKIRQNVSVFSADTKEELTLGDFIKLQARRGSRARVQGQAFSGDSVFMSENVASAIGVKVGEGFTMENAAGRRAEFTLTGIVENYVGTPVYIGFDVLKERFPSIIGTNAILTAFDKSIYMTKEEKDNLYSALLNCPDVESLQFKSERQNVFESLLSSISLVVLFLIVAAGALAIIVLYNLTYINISERAREIATLRVLGFHRNEAASYIFREIVILSIIGAVAGLALGIPLHSFIISIAGNPDMMFGKTIEIKSFLFSFLITIIFSAVVDLILVKKIITIKMSESLKSVE